jgi:hypothetical protein
MKIQRMVMATLSAGVAIFLFWAAFHSEGSYGGADSFMHYYFARYAWQQPGLFLDHWGKPLFTLLSSPFAAFGFIGIRVFNMACGLAGAYLAFATAVQLKLRYPLVAGIMALTATLGPVVWLSGLTEPLFGLTLVLALYLAAKNHLWLSALVISFIPMVRTEGIIFLPLWMLGLVLLKRYRAMPFAFAGVALYSVIGGLAGLGFDWIWAGSPYGSAPVYGSGELLHFWKYREETFGSWFILFFILGMAYLATQWKTLIHVSLQSVVWGLVLTTVVGYFAAHSVVWYLGTGSSAGLTRVMVGIIPAAAILTAAGMELFSFVRIKYISPVAYLLIAVAGTLQFKGSISGTGHLSVPTKWGVEERALQEVVDYLHGEGLTEEYVVYYNPIIAFMLDLNPFTTEGSREKVPNPNAPESELPAGALVIYDNHFGPNEGNLPQHRLANNPAFTQLISVPASEEHRMPNGELYRVTVYQKKDVIY